MKVRSLLFSTLCMLAISVTFTSCSDDDDAPWNDEGTKVELPQRRMFILNEGKADNNNAGIAFYAPNRDANDSNNNFIANIYFKQNEKQLGDTGQDILEYEDNIYVIVSGSSLLLKLRQWKKHAFHSVVLMVNHDTWQLKTAKSTLHFGAERLHVLILAL